MSVFLKVYAIMSQELFSKEVSAMRQAQISRKTSETQIDLKFAIDGSGQRQILTGIPFFDHMLDLFTKHGHFDLSLNVKGDIEIDYHHTVEDVGICLGEAFRQALGDSKGIVRYASGLIPMDECLCQLAVDLSNRPYLSFKADLGKTKVGSFDVELAEEFFRAFVMNARITLHLELLSGENLHHIIEACFKALGVVLDRSSMTDSRKNDIPSTKGTL